MKLNDKACSTAKPKEKIYKLYDGGVEVTPKGGKLWRLKYRYFNKQSYLSAFNLQSRLLCGQFVVFLPPIINVCQISYI